MLKEKLAYVWDKWKIVIMVVLAISLTSIAFNLIKPSNPVTTEKWTAPPEPKVVTKIERVPVPGPKQIITIEKKVIVERLKLPDTFKNNTSLQAIAAADLEPSKGGYTVVGTIDTKTGVGGILAKEKERSLIGLPSNVSVGTRYGLVTDGRTEVNGYIKYQPLRVGNVYLGVYGEVGSNREGKAMLELEYKFKSD